MACALKRALTGELDLRRSERQLDARPGITVTRAVLKPEED
jgi:hypothetical protein